MDYSLRPVTEADREWLFALRREAYWANVIETWGEWDDTAQRARFDEIFSPADTQIVVVEGRDAGLLHVERSARELFLANIAFAPEFRGRGLGTVLIRALHAEAAARGVPFRLQVLKVNHAARRLYERLGFTLYEETASHFRLIARRA